MSAPDYTLSGELRVPLNPIDVLLWTDPLALRLIGDRDPEWSRLRDLVAELNATTMRVPQEPNFAGEALDAAIADADFDAAVGIARDRRLEYLRAKDAVADARNLEREISVRINIVSARLAGYVIDALSAHLRGIVEDASPLEQDLSGIATMDEIVRRNDTAALYSWNDLEAYARDFAAGLNLAAAFAEPADTTPWPYLHVFGDDYPKIAPAWPWNVEASVRRSRGWITLAPAPSPLRNLTPLQLLRETIRSGATITVLGRWELQQAVDRMRKQAPAEQASENRAEELERAQYTTLPVFTS